MKDLILSILQGKQKAIVGGAVAGILVLLAQVGVNGDMTFKDALTTLGSWVLTHAVVWKVENK
jgi:hypothetical protein